MAYEAISFAGFGKGLNLRDKADAISEEECIDCLNVEFTETGAVRQRSGYAVWTAGVLDGQGDTLFPHYESDGTKHLLVGDIATGQMTALSSADGTEIDIEASFSTGGCFGFQRFGAPGTEYTYLGNGVDELWYYNGTAFTNVPDDTGARVPPKGGALAISPAEGGNTSNRLVNARFTTTTGGPGGATTTPSTIWFSDPGNPVVWPANNYLHLDPGDGEAIQDIINWREFLFVFKETKFYVFTGESVDSSGNPIFNYYTVNTGNGACGPRAVTADETGVYFASRRGVFRTVGGQPECVSDLVEPVWSGAVSDYFTGGVLAHAAADKVAVNAFDGRIHVNYATSSTNNRTLVYDTSRGWWSLWDVAAADMVGFRAGNQAQLFFTYPAGTDDVARIDPAYTSDAGVAITSYWRSGWWDGGLSIVKTVRETKSWGSGRVYLGLSTDFRQGVGTLDQLNFVEPGATSWGSSTWGGGYWSTGSARGSLLTRRAVRGTVFSNYFYNNVLDQGWTVARLDNHLRESRIPSVKNPSYA